MTSRTGSDRAFTLVEITIVIFIMATMMAVAVPYFLHYYNEARLDGAAREFATATQLARLQAVTQQREATMEFDLDRQTYAIFVGAPDSGAALVESFAVPLKVRLATVQVGEEPVQDGGQFAARFYPNGTCDGLTALFRAGDRKGGTAVWVDPVTSRATAYAVK